MNTITLDNATYDEMSHFASLNNLSIPEMLKDSWHDFMEYVKSKNPAKPEPSIDEFLQRFSGDWENDKSSVEVVEEYRRNNHPAPEKQLVW